MEYDLGDDEEEEEANWWFSTRLGIATMAFFGCMSMMSQRACMQVAIICMINHTDVITASANVNTTVDNHTNGYTSPVDVSTTVATTPRILDEKMIVELCGPRPDIFPENLTLGPMKDGEFDWSEEDENILYQIFFWGFFISQVPAGWLATRFGGRLVFGGFAILASCSTGLVPLAARTHLYLLILVRFITGVGVGAAFPCMHAVWGRWAPPEDRTQLASIPFAGAMLGHVLTYPTSAVLCHYGYLGGWPFIFYFLGGLGLVWAVFWLLFMSDNPIKHPRISELERFYIVDSLTGHTEFTQTKEYRTPCCKFLTSLPFLCLIICTFCHEWAMYTYEVTVPDFMMQIIKFDLKKDPVIYALPYIGLWFMILIAGVWADKLHSRAFIPIGPIRKVMQCVGTLIPAGLLVGLGFLKCHNANYAVAVLVSAMSITGFQFSAFMTSPLDFAPRYAGIMMGIANTLGMIAHVACPYLLMLFDYQETSQRWQTTFYLAASLLVFSALCFVLLSSGEIEEWAMCDDDLESDYDSLDSAEYSDTEYDPESAVESTPSTPAIPKAKKASISLDIHPEIGQKSKPRTPKSPRKRNRKFSNSKRVYDYDAHPNKKSSARKKSRDDTILFGKSDIAPSLTKETIAEDNEPSKTSDEKKEVIGNNIPLGETPTHPNGATPQKEASPPKEEDKSEAEDDNANSSNRSSYRDCIDQTFVDALEESVV